MNFPISIDRTSLLPILVVLSGIFDFYSKVHRIFCKQTMDTLIRRRLHCLPFSHKRTLGLYGLTLCIVRTFHAFYRLLFFKMTIFKNFFVALPIEWQTASLEVFQWNIWRNTHIEYQQYILSCANSNWIRCLTLCILETSKWILWQTVRTKTKCSIMLHFIRVCTVS